MIDTFNGALMIKRELMLRLHESPRVISQGLMVVLMVGLIVGGINGIRVILGSLNPEQELETVREAMIQSIDEQALAAQSLEQRMILGVIKENIDPGIEIAENMMALPTTLPQPVGAVTQGIAAVVSGPPAYLGNLLLAVIFTHIAAFWLGGRGSIQNMLGLGALSVAPHALDALAFIPVLGGMLQAVATLWGIAILVVATSIAHQLSTERSILAVLFFPLIAGIFLILGCCVLFGLAVTAGAGAG